MSRGELVEIGGGFRVPEIMAESGCRLVEVGTTNRTRRADYERALRRRHRAGPEGARVELPHDRVPRRRPVAELATLGAAGRRRRRFRAARRDDAVAARTRPTWLHDEPGVRQASTPGAALVTFSGDKLLGGPQAGVIVGRRDVVDAVARAPARARVRADKMTLAALQAVALAYLVGRRDVDPVLAHGDDDRSTSCAARAETIAARGPGREGRRHRGGRGRRIAAGARDPVGRRRGRVRRSGRHAARVSRAAASSPGSTTARVVCDLRTVDPADDARLAARALPTPA